MSPVRFLVTPPPKDLQINEIDLQVSLFLAFVVVPPLRVKKKGQRIFPVGGEGVRSIVLPV